MMKVIRLSASVFLLTFLIANQSNAQKSIILQHSGDASLHTTINSALGASADGDTIYISGGVYSEDVTITKNLVIYGAGHYPDSTNATGPTILSGSIGLSGLTGPGLLEGISVTGNIIFQNGVSNYSILRCTINSISFSGAYTYTNFLFSENVIKDYLSLNNLADNILVEKNIIGKRILNFNKTSLVVRNNIFLWTPTVTYRVIENVYGAYFRNNIFTINNASLTNNLLTDNTFENNITVYTIALNSSNLVGVDLSTIFVNQSGMLFDYAHDYHMKSGSPGIAFGTDGTDAGIYGTSKPYKLSSVPSNPHISVSVIADETDADGKLSVRFVVIGQN